MPFGSMVGARGRPSKGDAPLSQYLAAYYAMSGASGAVELDLVSGYNLTAVNSPGSVVGAVNSARSFAVANLQSLEVADAAGNPFDPHSQNFGFCAWVRPSSLTTTRGIIAKGGASDAQPGYQLTLTSAGNVSVRFGDGVTTRINLVSTTLVTTGTTAHILVSFHRPTVATLYVNGIVEATAGIAAYGIVNTTRAFRVGADGSASPALHFDGWIDEVGFWLGYAPTARDALWLAGGRTLSQIRAYGG